MRAVVLSPTSSPSRPRSRGRGENARVGREGIVVEPVAGGGDNSRGAGREGIVLEPGAGAGLMAILSVYEDTVFEDQVVWLKGYAYFDCTFRRCTMILSGLEGVMTGCEITDCVWHLDFTVSDRTQWAAFMQTLGPGIANSLPREQPRRKK